MGACPDAEALERFACMGQKPARGRCTHPPPRRGASEGGVSPRCRHCLASPAALPQPLSELSPPSQAASAWQGGTLPPGPRPASLRIPVPRDPCVLQAPALAPPLGISL